MGVEEGQSMLGEALKILLMIDRIQSHEGPLQRRFHPGSMLRLLDNAVLRIY